MNDLSNAERLNRAVRSLRNYIRDKKELNALFLGNYETSDEEARQCVIASLVDWNMSPPLITPVTLESHPNKLLLLQKAAIEALQSAGIWHSREHLPSTDGGTSADDHAKASEYSGWIERLNQEYERKKTDLKVAINIREAYGNMALASEYGEMYSLYGEMW